MTLPVWPALLPRPTRSGYQAQERDPRLRKKADAGRPGYRRRFTAVSRNVALTVQLNRAEKALFERFYKEVGNGTKPFWMIDPTTDGWAVFNDAGAPLTDHAGNPLVLSASWLCLFGETPPSETIVGLEFVVSFTVEVMP